MVLDRKVRESLEEVLEGFGIEATPDVEEQFIILLTALKIYSDRGKIYGDTWTTYGALNNLLRAATKVDRSMEIWWHDQSENNNPLMHKDNLDDAIDAVNYLVFFIRCVRAGNITGSKRERPIDVDALDPPSKVLSDMLFDPNHLDA